MNYAQQCEDIISLFERRHSITSLTRSMQLGGHLLNQPIICHDGTRTQTQIDAFITVTAAPDRPPQSMRPKRPLNSILFGSFSFSSYLSIIPLSLPERPLKLDECLISQ